MDLSSLYEPRSSSVHGVLLAQGSVPAGSRTALTLQGELHASQPVRQQSEHSVSFWTAGMCVHYSWVTRTRLRLGRCRERR